MVQVGETIEAALGDWCFAGKILITIPDATRPLDPIPPLDALRARCPNITETVIGLGLHRAMTPSELSTLRGFPIQQHDPDHVISTAVVDGIPGFVYKGVAKAEACLSVGIAELHQYAGLSGGHKGIAVGCGGRTTILALHHRDRIVQEGVRIGQIDGNPFRAAIDGLGAAAGCRWCLNYVPLLDKWFFGEPAAVLQEISRVIKPWFFVPKMFSGALLRVPPEKGVSFYQASRAASYLALSPSPPVQRGGVLVLEAPMPEGLGSESGFVQALSAVPPPWSSFLTGVPPTGPGSQRAVILALLMQNYTLWLTGVKHPQIFHNIGLRATSDIVPPSKDWLVVEKPFSYLPQIR
ncbi:MAG: lactate racemase domain-containing protein [Myxococcota bacterium]|nr:lactate racemase domain-containing protein [Myxococcota bacterium]